MAGHVDLGAVVAASVGAVALFSSRLGLCSEALGLVEEQVLLLRGAGGFGYDPLFYACDETLHGRPDRVAPEDEEVRLVEAINGAASVLDRAMRQLEGLRERRNGR